VRVDREHMSLGEYLRAARERAGYSIRELANRVSVHFSYLARLESGETARPAPDLLQRLAAVLDVDAAELLAYIGVKPELPEPRAYFRRKLGVNAEEADVLARLIEDYQANRRTGGHHEETN
jgi:transcriptional regulator with XRE-family HTH domain